ncbi:cell division protein ZapE [Deferribacter abyssi]|uniref:cell division protein ZapE n=1 Tax=Deferribacter abyssi TaxID=213806 RepID=UPI003C270208
MIGVDYELRLPDLNFDVSVEISLKNLKPHPKFSNCSFENYYPDEKYPSQHFVKQMLFEKISKYNDYKNRPVIRKKSLFSFLTKSEDNGNRSFKNAYLDGGFGVGKTHLLAACYNVAKCKKAFMSFSELCYYINYIGLNESIEIFSDYDLLLIDEFEIDDPATVRIMAKFFSELNEDTLIITTSNTLPGDLGKNRFQADEFKREMGVIANTFKVVIVEGEDYRSKKEIWKRTLDRKPFEVVYGEYIPSSDRKKMIVSFDELMVQLEQVHPFRFFVIPENADAIFIRDMKPFPLLNSALRFTHFVDLCYYYNTRLFIKSEYDLKDIFSEEMLESCFEKKLKRCISRLSELGIFYHN